MSRSGKVSGTFEFLQVFGAAEKIKQSLRAAEKSQEKVEANGTGFSAEFFGSQSVEMFCFTREKKSNVGNFFPGLDKNPSMSF